MLDGKPSDTAIHVAAVRAAHLRYDPAPHLLEDELAEELLGDEHEATIDMMADGAHWNLRESRLFFPLRARWAEDHLLEAYARGVRQYVVLGAGLDTFAFRQPAGVEELEIIEVDHPSTQRWKRSRIAALGWTIPDNVKLVECDFESSSVSDALAKAEFRAEEPAFVNWMGVIYYLESSTASAALRELSTLLAPGSSVVLDYMRPCDGLSDRYRELERLSREYLERKGEPQINKLLSTDLRAQLLGAGFEGALLVDEADLETRYTAELATDVPLSERFGLAIASK